MVDENVVEKTETTPADKTKENEEAAPEKTEKQPEEVDYKAELERLKAENVKKDGIISHKEDMIKAEKDKRKELEEAGLNEEEIQEKVRETIASEMDNYKKSFVTDVIEDEIERVSTSKEEAELIRFHFDNSVKLQGTTRREIKNAIEAAKMLANKKKIMSNNRELAEALQAKATTRTAPEGAGEKIQSKEPDNLTEEERKFIEKYDIVAKKIVQDAPATNAK